MAEVVRHMRLIRTLRWIYDDYWKAKRNRWDEDEYVRDEGIAIGEARGREAGRSEGKTDYILQLLNALGEVPSDLFDRIKSEHNTELLDRWHLSAARADSIEQFREKENI